MFTVYQERQYIYANNANSPPIRQFSTLQIFGLVACHVIMITRTKVQGDLEINFYQRKIHVFLGILVRDIVN